MKIMKLDIEYSFTVDILHKNEVYDSYYDRFFKRGNCPICNCETFDDPVVGLVCSFHLRS